MRTESVKKEKLSEGVSREIGYDTTGFSARRLNNLDETNILPTFGFCNLFNRFFCDKGQPLFQKRTLS